jgi:hypothetical protein
MVTGAAQCCAEVDQRACVLEPRGRAPQQVNRFAQRIDRLGSVGEAALDTERLPDRPGRAPSVGDLERAGEQVGGGIGVAQGAVKLDGAQVLADQRSGRIGGTREPAALGGSRPVSSRIRSSRWAIVWRCAKIAPAVAFMLQFASRYACSVRTNSVRYWSS